eukprot:2864252-Rhodomonas_salina.1
MDPPPPPPQLEVTTLDEPVSEVNSPHCLSHHDALRDDMAHAGIRYGIPGTDTGFAASRWQFRQVTRRHSSETVSPRFALLDKLQRRFFSILIMNAVERGME